MTRYPAKVDARIIRDLIVANAALECMHEPDIVFTSVVVKA